jgi:hypothetical protein
MQIEGLQKNYKHQKQTSKEKEICDILSFFFEEKNLTLFIFKPHIFLIFNPF